MNQPAYTTTITKITQTVTVRIPLVVVPTPPLPPSSSPPPYQEKEREGGKEGGREPGREGVREREQMNAHCIIVDNDFTKIIIMDQLISCKNYSNNIEESIPTN